MFLKLMWTECRYIHTQDATHSMIIFRIFPLATLFYLYCYVVINTCLVILFFDPKKYAHEYTINEIIKNRIITLYCKFVVNSPLFSLGQ